MRKRKARALLKAGNDGREDALKHGCFGDCCLTEQDKRALITLIYGSRRNEP